MSDQGIRVGVAHYSDRTNLIMRYKDPLTGKLKQRTTGTNNRREAVRIAHKWEAELNAGRGGSGGKMAWEEFRERYEEVHLPSLAEKSYNAAGTAFNALDRLCPPKRLADLTAARLSEFASQLRAESKRLSVKFSREKRGLAHAAWR